MWTACPLYFTSVVLLPPDNPSLTLEQGVPVEEHSNHKAVQVSNLGESGQASQPRGARGDVRTTHPCPAGRLRQKTSIRENRGNPTNKWT